MEKLNYEVLKKSGYTGYILESAPEKVMQFGEGNFLRAFVNYWFDLANEKAGWNGKCVLVQPIAPGLANACYSNENKNSTGDFLCVYRYCWQYCLQLVPYPLMVRNLTARICGVSPCRAGTIWQRAKFSAFRPLPATV